MKVPWKAITLRGNYVHYPAVANRALAAKIAARLTEMKVGNATFKAEKSPNSESWLITCNRDLDLGDLDGVSDYINRCLSAGQAV